MDKIFRSMLLVALLFTLSVSTTAFCSGEFMPTWKVGDNWMIEAKYRNLISQENEWLPPVTWKFSVRSEKVINGEPCWVLHISPVKRGKLKVQAVLFLSKKDLHTVKKIDIFPVKGKAQAKAKEFNAARPSPLFSDESMIPYDLPVFPLSAAVKENDANSTSVGLERAVSVDNITFVDKVAQSWKPVNGGFEISLHDPDAKGEIKQIWKENAPWAVSMNSNSVQYQLIQK
ncbi:MAG: hypothetical protein HQM10_18670 [Candidatus Riflebacteria bacterium]|nr:hypothetical protein [Candidatus Riflebacteria bacterium]